LGPGLLESAYEACLVYELRLRRLKVEAQLLSYLRLYGTCARGMLINFNVKRLVEGHSTNENITLLCVLDVLYTNTQFHLDGGAY
jgi:hypothetical protein